MREALAWNYAQAGWLNTASALSYVAGAVTGYFLLQKISPARLFAVGLWLTFSALLLTGLTGALTWLTVTRVASGIRVVWTFFCGTTLIAARYLETDSRRGTAMGLFFAGAGLGIVLSELAVGPLLAGSGPRGWLWAWTLMGALALLLSIWPLLETRWVRIGASAAAGGGGLSLRGMRMALLGCFVFAAGCIVYMTFILACIRAARGSWQLGTLVWLTLGAGVAASPLVWQRALAHWQPALTLSASCAAMSAGAAIPLFDAHAVGLLVSAALFGLGVFIAPSAVAVLLRQNLPAAQLARGMAVATVVFSAGQTIGAVAADWIADAYSLNQSLMFGLPALKPCPSGCALKAASAAL